MCANLIPVDALCNPARDRSLWRQALHLQKHPDVECRSPCLGVCRMSPSGLCVGCWRSLDEIKHWGSASLTEQRDIWQRIAHRLHAVYPQGLSGSAEAA